MSQKRPREPTGVDIALVEIYEDLAHENEEIRLKAANLLLTKYLPNSDLDKVKTILKRLFRGLCSSRKAARPGFAVALTETLYQLRGRQTEAPDKAIPLSQIVDILEEQTATEGKTSGQDERDHYFGRLFGVGAIIKSEILFDDQDLDQWNRLLDLVCATALKKPWTRQEFGWTLYSCVKRSLKNNQHQYFAVAILEKLSEHRLVRTPEGLAIWIEIQRLHPKAKLPRHVWKHHDPLSRKDLPTLADVLKNAKAGSKPDAEFEAQGSATWVASLHFVWDVVLTELFASMAGHGSEEKDTYLEEFWHITVDEALLSPASSPERKHWGFLVMQKALEQAPESYSLVRAIISERATSCLISSLKSSDGYLQRSAQKVLQKINRCVTKSPENADVYILSLLSGAGMIDFDAVTKTKTVHDLMHESGPAAVLRIANRFTHELGQTSLLEPTELTRRRRVILNYQLKLIFQQANAVLAERTIFSKAVFHTILQTWIELCYGRSTFDETMKKLVREKIQMAFEQLLKLGKDGQELMLDVIEEIYRYSTPAEIAQAEAEIQQVVKAGWKRFEKLHDIADTHSDGKHHSTNGEARTADSEWEKPDTNDQELVQGLALLYGLVLFEIHSGDIEAIQILRELLELGVDSADTRSKTLGPSMALNADVLIEILLGFASRPSKFLRRITLTIFETFTHRITGEGLKSLTTILEVKETRGGQQELFAAPDENDEVASESSNDEEDIDTEMLDSNVEIVDGSDSDSSSGSNSDETSSTSSLSNEEDNHDAELESAELLALEASLASALGTRKLTQNDKAADSSSDSSSDSDMTDSEMMALDEKLAEVFRNRAHGSYGAKKKEQKSAKENIVNFKNRVLDMLEVYTRREYQNPRSLDLILPLLHLSRQTRTKQLADRAVRLLQAYGKRCNGLQKVPTLPLPHSYSSLSTIGEDQQKPTPKKKKSKSETHKAEADDHPVAAAAAGSSNSVPETLTLLRAIHDEASLPTVSNAHRATCSKCSILVVKTLLKTGVVPFNEFASMYDHTRTNLEQQQQQQKQKQSNGGEKKEKKKKEKNKELGVVLSQAQKAFFDDWENWLGSVKGRI